MKAGVTCLSYAVLPSQAGNKLERVTPTVPEMGSLKIPASLTLMGGITQSGCPHLRGRRMGISLWLTSMFLLGKIYEVGWFYR